jgi:release factor glutamine methyltransferase
MTQASSELKRFCRFQGLDLLLAPHHPAPRSAILLDAALALPAGATLHDLGCGAGALALAAKQLRPDLQVSGSDSDEQAVEFAIRNAAHLDLQVSFFCSSSWPEGGGWDLVIANLPYYCEREREELAAELLFEPLQGLLIAGDDPLALLREVVSSAPESQRLALQHRHAQSREVRALLSDSRTWPATLGRPVMTVGRVPVHA